MYYSFIRYISIQMFRSRCWISGLSGSSVPSLCCRKHCTCALGATWAPKCAQMGRSGATGMPKGAQMRAARAPLGTPRALTWAAWEPKGAQMDHLGATWVPKGARRGCSGGTWVPKGAPMGRSSATGVPKGAQMGRLEGHLGAQGRSSRLNCAAQCAQVLLSAHRCR